MLRVWVAQAKQQHAAAANFPYYLMANPHLLQHPQYSLGGIPNLTQQRHPLNLPGRPADEAAINRLLFNYMNRNVNNRQNQFMNNQQRNEESELMIACYCFCAHLTWQLGEFI